MERRYYPTGSEWIKCDLHIHTPYSICKHNYGNSQDESTWEKFIADLETLPSDFKVIGINDYLFIEGYEKISEYKKKGRLKNIDLILPVVEFRLKKFAGNEKFKKINYHVIFSDQLKSLTINQQFLNQLYGKFKLSDLANEADWSGAITKESLADLGAKIRQSIPEDKKSEFTESDLELGFNNICFNEDDILKTLKNSKYLKGEYITAIGKAEWDQFEWNDNSIAEKKSIINGCNFVFVSSESVEKFNKAKNKLESERVNNLLLDCSDAHSFSDSEVKDKIGKCFTWIKSTPTFEGLKQVLYEKDRVYIGEEPPMRADISKVIKSIIIEKSGNWFESDEILINPWSASIIGGKGTGKTALLDLLALTANKRWNEFEGNDNSFLEKAKNELGNVFIKVKWCDDSEDECELKEFFSGRAKSTSNDKVVYLSQGFISHLCSKPDELQKQIEAVIYQNVENEDKAIYANFEEYKKSRLGAVKNKQSEIRQKLTTDNSRINNCVELISNESENDKNTEIKSKEVKRIENEIKKISSGLKEDKNKKIFDNYQKEENNKTKLEKEISKLSEGVRNIDLILEKIDSLKNEFGNSITEINELLENLGIKTKVSIKVLPDNIRGSLNKKKEQRKNDIIEKTKELKKVKEEIDSLSKQLEFEKSKQERIKELNELYKKASEQKASLLEKKEKIKNAKTEIAKHRKEQAKLFNSFFVTLFQEKEILEHIYNPLETILESSEEENKNFFRFSVKLDFDYDTMAKKGYHLIDRRKKGRYQNREMDVLLQDLKEKKENNFKLDFASGLDNKELSSKNKQALDDFRKSVFALFDEEKSDNPELEIKNKLNSEYVIKDFYDWIFSTDYYRLSYSIKFNDKDLHSLSPGLKGVALLILYLELDRDNNNPILIDQPEENLDNRFIYNTLVKYFRNAKRRRQILIATHNANLVVNTDSEQVFVANFDKDKREQKKYISYISGAIEDTFQDEEEKVFLKKCGIREHIIDVLEGSEDAFKKREERYNLFSK